MRGKLYRLVYLWIRDRSLAEDVLQNVFEKSVERESELQSHPNLSGWLVRSLKNEVLMHFRKFGRIDSLEGMEEIQEVQTETEEYAESVKMIVRLMKELPLKQQEVIQLREVEGLTYEEIAEYLEISMDQVKVNLHRARKSIRESITKHKSTL